MQVTAFPLMQGTLAGHLAILAILALILRLGPPILITYKRISCEVLSQRMVHALSKLQQMGIYSIFVIHGYLPIRSCLNQTCNIAAFMCSKNAYIGEACLASQGLLSLQIEGLL